MVEKFTKNELTQRCPARFTRNELVPQRFYSAGKGNETKRTEGLTTCTRIAVVGTYGRGHSQHELPDRFLAHVDDLEDPPLQPFLRQIRAAKRADLRDLRAYVLTPDPEKEDSESIDTDVEERGEELLNLLYGAVDKSAVEVDYYHVSNREGRRRRFSLMILADKNVRQDSWSDESTGDESEDANNGP